MGYKVVAPLVIVGDGAGRMYHFYKDSVLPDEGLDAEHLKSLVADGMILEEKAAAKAEATAPVGDSEPAPAKKAAAKKAAASE